MRYLKQIAAILILAAMTGSVLAAEGALPSDDDIAKAVLAVYDYDVANPRTALSDVERIIRQTYGNPDKRQHIERQFIRLLESPSTDEAMHFACEQLRYLGGDASVAVLRKMLGDDRTAHMACLALGGNPGAAAGNALRDEAATVKGNALLCIVGLLGDRRDQASEPMLIAMLERNDPPAVQAAAVALGKIATPQAAAALAKARTSADANLRNTITQACLQCAAGLAAQAKPDQAAAVYRQLLAENEPILIRRGALAGLIELGGPDAVPLVLSMMANRNALLQATAIARIRTLQGQAVTAQFAEELPKLSPSLQSLLIGALEDRGDPAARSAIAAAAASDSADVRLAAIKALGALGDPASVAILSRAAADGKTEAEKRTALLSLRRLRGDGVDSAIVQSMKTATGETRPQLIEILSDRGATSALPALLAEAKAGQAASRGPALRAIAQLAGADSLRPLLDLLVAIEADEIRADAENAVIAVARKLASEPARADLVLATLATVKTPAARSSLLRVLRGIGNANAFQAVQAALKDADTSVQDAAVRALAEWPDARAVPALLDLCRTTRNDTHRIVALRGCVRLMQLTPGQVTPDTLKAYEDLMELARRPEERKLVLGALANLPHPRALAIADVCLADPDVSAEATLATVNIARVIKGAYRDETAAAMKKLAIFAKDQDVRRQAEGILAQITKFGDYTTAWQVSGPYMREGLTGQAVFGTAFDVEKDQAKGIPWRILPAGNDEAKAMIMDLAGLFGGNDRVAYARTWVWAEKAQDARLELGVDDGAQVWLNGKLVHSRNVGGACVPGAEKINVSLRQGFNALLVKVVQWTGPWEFCLRLCNRDGSPIQGLRADCAGPASEQAKGVSIFDGKTFEGWEGPLNAFRIEDGAIVGGTLKAPIPRNEFLSTAREYGDFELRLKFRLFGKDPNAGVQFRSRRVPNSNEMSGYQADLGQNYWGCIYDESRRNRVVAQANAQELRKVLKLEDWNEYVIRCEGSHIRLWINGYQTVDYTEQDERIERTGVIGLQIHSGQPSEAWYKDIVITELKPERP